MNAPERYLRLASSYCDFLGGLRWSSQEDAVELYDGSTFAFHEEIVIFLEGFASRAELVHFAFILHLLYLLRNVNETNVPRSQRLKQAFAKSGSGPLRNAGAFCAVLCRSIPTFAGPLDCREVIERLRDTLKPMRWFLGTFHDTFYPTETPPLGPAEFEKEIFRAIDCYTDEEILSWVRYGRGPVRDAGKALARALPPPRTLAGALAALLERPRLAGARPFVAQMQSSLSLPPRRHLRPQVALGGYSEVTNTGQPHHLLLSQFALDEWDFLRRYADRELLYFRREDPQVNARHELIVLLDQGPRTWGDVRLVLGAAALALGRNATQAKMPFLIATTGRDGEVVDPVDADSETFAEMVEGSDLSANPGLALERVLERPAEGLRDVVLLTHPRCLLEDDVRVAALRADKSTRLLALTLNGRGEAALSEVRHGTAVPIRQFRVDFDDAPAPPIEIKPITQQRQDWRGDIELVPFPFRFGCSHQVRPHMFDFSHDGDWLITVGTDGVCHAWSTDGNNGMEVLPRAFSQGQIGTIAEAIVGVAGGFVVAGRDQGRLMAVHYDLHKRTCTAHALAMITDVPTLIYSPEHHAIVIRSHLRGQEHSLDLSTGFCFPGDTSERADRARKAWYAAAQGQLHPAFLACVPDTGTAAMLNLTNYCTLDPKTGLVRVLGTPFHWAAFTPLADGRSSLKGCRAIEAKWRGNVLGLKVNDSRGSPGTMLRLFQGPQGTALAEYHCVRVDSGFALSSDGRLLARQIAGGRVEVRPTNGDTSPVAATYAGGFSFRTQLELGERWLLVGAGRKSVHLLRWDTGRLTCRCTRGKQELAFGAVFVHNPDAQLLLKAEFGERAKKLPSIEALAAGVPASLHYDRNRFLAGATTSVTAVLDRFGQVLILDSAENVVCMFFIFRDQLSCWLPDGTNFGPASASRRKPTPDDLENVGRVLTAASDQRRNTPCK